MTATEHGTTFGPSSSVPPSSVPPSSVPSAASVQSPKTRRLARAYALGCAAVATSAVWGVAKAAGVDFKLTDSQGSVVIGLPTVIGFTLFCAGLGWAALAVLERFSARAIRIWTGLAVGVLALSIVPIFLEHATAGTRTSLIFIHVAVAAVLIPSFRKSANER
ncbi:DUF6069 family protein [Jatrophihabitans sp. DSM 45814]